MDNFSTDFYVGRYLSILRTCTTGTTRAPVSGAQDSRLRPLPAATSTRSSSGPEQRTTACETRLRHNRPRVANRHAQSTPPAAGPANRRHGSDCRWGTSGPEADQVRDQAVRPGAPPAAYFCSQHQQLLRAAARELQVCGALAGIPYLLSSTIDLDGYFTSLPSYTRPFIHLRSSAKVPQRGT